MSAANGVEAKRNPVSAANGAEASKTSAAKRDGAAVWDKAHHEPALASFAGVPLRYREGFRGRFLGHRWSWAFVMVRTRDLRAQHVCYRLQAGRAQPAPAKCQAPTGAGPTTDYQPFCRLRQKYASFCRFCRIENPHALCYALLKQEHMFCTHAYLPRKEL